MCEINFRLKELTESWIIFPVRCFSCLYLFQSNCSAQYHFVCFCFASYFNSSFRLSYLCRTSSPNMKSVTSRVRRRTQRTCARLRISLKTCRPATTTATSSAPWMWWGNAPLWCAHHKPAQWRSGLLLLCRGSAVKRSLSIGIFKISKHLFIKSKQKSWCLCGGWGVDLFSEVMWSAAPTVFLIACPDPQRA